MSYPVCLMVARRWFLVLVFASWLGCAPQTREPVVQPAAEKTPVVTNATKPPEATPQEEASEKPAEVMWDALFLQGQKIGYGFTERFVTKDSAGEIVQERWRATQVLRLKRFGQVTEQSIYFSSLESPNSPLQFQSKLSGKSMNVATSGEIREGFLELTIQTDGRSATKSIPWPAGTGGFFAVEQSLLKQPLRAGEKRQIKWFQPVMNQITTDELEAVAEEEVPLLEGRRKLLKIKNTSHLSGQKIVSFFWIDSAGRLLRSTIPGMMQEVYRTSKEVAMQPGEGSFDLGRSTIVKVKQPLGNHVNLQRVVYLAKLKTSNPNEVFPQGLTQEVKTIDEHTAELTIHKVTPQTALSAVKITPPVPADSAPNQLIQSDDVNVKQLASQISKTLPDAWAKARAAETLVNQKLNKKNFSQAFATAAEVAKNLEGDCTEHAVLLAAICRAQGIPARVAAGLVYYAPESGFAYHMWNEVWIGDRWIPLDATLAQGGIGGGHIKLFDSNLDGADAFSAFLPVMHVLGQLELDVKEVE